MAHVRSLSPNALHNSIFEKTQAKNALRLRQSFLNDLSPPNEESAVALLERIVSVYHAARLEHGYHRAKNAKLGSKRPYGGKRGKPRVAPPASIPSPQQMSKTALMLHKLHRDDWFIPDVITVSEERIAAGMKAEVEIISARLGINSHEPEDSDTSATRARDAQKGDDDETAKVFRSLSPTERFQTLNEFHDIDAADDPAAIKAASFLSEHRAWRRGQSWHACVILSQFEDDLKRTRLFSNADLEEIGRHYKVDTLPAFPGCRHIGTLTAKIAIAMEASRSVGGTSPNICIDPALAAAVAAKYNAYLAKQAVLKGCRKRSHP